MTPDRYTIQETSIDVGDGHSLYVHEWGNAQSEMKVINLHGGPGGQSKDRHKQIFNPEKHHVVFFDQRGSGKSTPYGSLEHNTTAEMIGDITKIADHVGFRSFYLTGGSWGSCLALAYALEHPERVDGMVLNGIFTGSQSEIDWIEKGMFRTFFPDVWATYLEATPEDQRQDPSAYHFRQMLGNDPVAAKRSAFAYEQLEGSVIKLDDRLTTDPYETYDPAGMTIEAHYMANRCFMPDRYILDNAHTLHMPVWLVQGRYDMVCPPMTAYELAKRVPQSELIWTTSGHMTERESWNVIRTVLSALAA